MLAVLGALWVVGALVVFHTNQEDNVLTSQWQRTLRPAVQTISPQQWAFFTKSPREPSYEPFVLNDARWRSGALFPHSRSDNLFGWDRQSRAQAIELGMLYADAESTQWHVCADSGTVVCLTAALADSRWPTTTNMSPEPTLCGKIGLVEREVTPWAWAGLTPGENTSRVLLLEVEC
ncbi:SdpA family antimicrobial peptide system protein [Diaminobutyricibacter sp. McL0618]|uniref:SdpA family antimicrobial peptide system protein n=1 Tax=Leifsonia sp. McL0618 TaxID=3415677 RepID=UPI003CFA8BAE